jgi:hypothetical protein
MSWNSWLPTATAEDRLHDNSDQDTGGVRWRSGVPVLVRSNLFGVDGYQFGAAIKQRHRLTTQHKRMDRRSRGI